MKNPTYRIVLIVLFLSCIFLASLLGGILIYKEFIYSKEKIPAILEVEEVYFVLASSEGGKYNISSKMFVTNTGEQDCDAKVRGFIIDRESNIAMDDSESDIGTIPAGKTVETPLDMEVLYNGSFRVELLVFKDGLITVKGSGIVTLSPGGVGGQDYRNTLTDPTEKKEKDNAIPFLGIPSIILGTVIAALLLAVIKRRRWSP